MMEQTHPVPPSNARLVRRLLLMVAVAFAFAFALVPLYNVLCEVTGFNGKTAGQGPIRDGFGIGGLKAETAPPANVDVTRTITVEFTGTVMPGLPWDMRPLTFKLDAHPGELQQVVYLVRNTSDREITGQAVAGSAVFRQDRMLLFFPADAGSRRIAGNAPRLYRQARR